MDVRVLRYFLTVANEGTITRAAELLHITQPTLSRQLAALEKEEGVQLFSRSNRKITLTKEGLILKRRAEQILNLVDRASEEIRGQEGVLAGRLIIGAGELKSLETLSRICGTFHELHPGVRFGIHTADANVVRENILRGDYDIGLMLEPVDLTPFEYIRMPDRERWVVILPEESPLAREECIQPEQLLGKPLYIPYRSSIQQDLKARFGPVFEELDLTYSGNLPSNAVFIVRSGYGYAIGIEGDQSSWNRMGTVSRPLYPENYATSVLVWRRDQWFGRLTEAFIDHARCFLGMI